MVACTGMKSILEAEKLLCLDQTTVLCFAIFALATICFISNSFFVVF